MSSGLEVHTRICRETTADKTFADLEIPLIAMTVDLNTRRPEPITGGTLWEAMLASTALAGMFPPFQRGDQRLVDGIALIPVPSDAVRDAGADIVVSVNLIGKEHLAAWPGQPTPEEKPKRHGSRMLDALLEVMDISQTEASVRHAERADVPITPVFGPGTWRDFDLADLYLAAGRAAALSKLADLQRHARPQSNALSGAKMHV
jgi:NTE family protein